MAGSAIEGPEIGPFSYVRFHGAAGKYFGSYGDDVLAGWAGRLAAEWQRGRDVYAYFNNDPEAVSTHDARRLRDMTFAAAGLESSQAAAEAAVRRRPTSDPGSLAAPAAPPAHPGPYSRESLVFSPTRRNTASCSSRVRAADSVLGSQQRRAGIATATRRTAPVRRFKNPLTTSVLRLFFCVNGSQRNPPRPVRSRSGRVTLDSTAALLEGCFSSRDLQIAPPTR